MNEQDLKPPGMDKPIKIEAADPDTLIIRHMQSTANDPFTFIGEAVKNSYTYGAREVTILLDRKSRKRSSVGNIVRIDDDGIGFPIHEASREPDFRVVFKHYGQSLAKKPEGEKRLLRHLKDLGLEDRMPKSEFGVGMGSFYAVGTALQIVTCSRRDDGTITRTFKTRLERCETELEPVTEVKPGFEKSGTHVAVTGLSMRARRQLKVEEVAEYVRVSHRDMVSDDTFRIVVTDRKNKVIVEPTSWEGEYLIKKKRHTKYGPIDVEIHIFPRYEERGVSIQRNGEIIYEDVAHFKGFKTPPWSNTPLVGLIDFPAADITDDRSGFVSGDKEDTLVKTLEKISQEIEHHIDLKKKSEDEDRRKSHEKRLRTAIDKVIAKLGYNPFELDRFDPSAAELPYLAELLTDKDRYEGGDDVGTTYSIANPDLTDTKTIIVKGLVVIDPNGDNHTVADEAIALVPAAQEDGEGMYSMVHHWTLGKDAIVGTYSVQMTIEFAGGRDSKRTSFSVGQAPPIGSLHRILIRPSIIKIQTKKMKTLRAEPVDKLGNLVKGNIKYHWETEDPEKLLLLDDKGQTVKVKAKSTLGITAITVTAFDASTNKLKSTTETVFIVPKPPPRPPPPPKTKFPNLELDKDRTGRWRSRYDTSLNLLYINAGHDDWIMQGGNNQEESNYILKLLAKEIAVLELGPETDSIQVVEYSISIMEAMGI